MKKCHRHMRNHYTHQNTKEQSYPQDYGKYSLGAPGKFINKADNAIPH